MGEVIELAAHRRIREGRPGRAGRPRPPVFHFDLASPFTYLAAERVERLFPGVTWAPTLGEALHGGSPWGDADAWARAARRADERARALRMPLVWPEHAPQPTRRAMRAAAHAADLGRAGEFVLAAGRLAFCGGYDLEDPEVLAEAAAAADLGLDYCLRAARDEARDGPMEAAGRRLLALGAHQLPVVRLGRSLFCGEHRIDEAAAAVAAQQRIHSVV